MTESATAAAHPPPLVDVRRMPYTLDAGLGERARIGLVVLATDQTIEHEFRRVLAATDGVALYQSRIRNAADITPETLAAMEAGISGAAALLVPQVRLDVVAYACTSGAMVIGEEVVHRRVREARPGVKCTTPMEAACVALRALERRRICFLPPYRDDINRAMRDVLLQRGFEVPVIGSWNISDDDQVARLSAQTLRAAILELGSHDAVDAVFVPCTNVRLASDVESVEAALGKPIISSNLATAWHCLRLAGYEADIAGFGQLFRRPLPGR